VIAADLTDPDTPARIADEVEREHGRLDLVPIVRTLAPPLYRRAVGGGRRFAPGTATNPVEQEGSAGDQQQG